MSALSTAISGEFISGTVVETVAEKASRLAQSIILSRETTTETLRGETTLDSVKAVLLETLRMLPERDDRETLAANVRKAIEREREAMAYIFTQYQNGLKAIPEGETIESAAMAERRLVWLADNQTLSLKTAKLDKVAISEKETKTYIPKSAAVADPKSETVADPKSETVADPKSETVADPKSETVADPKSETVADPKSETVAKSVCDIWQNRAIEAEAGLVKQSERIAQLEAENRALLAKLDEMTEERNRLDTECRALKFDAKPKRNRKAA